MLGDAALGWVRARNAATRAVLEAQPGFDALRRRMLDVLNSRDRIPYVSRYGDWFYNFWRDEDHKRGLWRRTTLDEYRRPEPDWQVLLDLDALAEAEGENWVAVGVPALPAGQRPGAGLAVAGRGRCGGRAGVRS